MTPTELLLRPATPADVPGIAAVQVAARASAAMPPGIHGPDEIRAYLSERFGAAENWVAEAGGRVVGYARFTREWLNDLYVDEKGWIYTNDRDTGGLYILEYTGATPLR